MTAKDRFKIGDRVKSSPTDPRSPRFGVVVGPAIPPWELKIREDGMPPEFATLTWADRWEAVEASA